MAYIIPSDLAQLALSGAHTGELATLGSFKSHLGLEYTVYHGVHWTRAYESKTAFGEIDFVVLNTDGRVLVIEQKNGALTESRDGLQKHYEDGPKNVPAQVRRNVEAIREKFRWQHAGRADLNIDYLLFCPDYRVVDLKAAGLDASRIVDVTRKSELLPIIERILGPGSGADKTRVDTIHRFFRQTFEVVPDVHTHISIQERAFGRSSAALLNVLENIEMKPLRLRVRGTAGCGKTGIAIRFYDRTVNDGRRPLLVCFNRPLREKLNAIVSGSGLVQTWYGLCAKFLESRGHKLDYERMPTDPHFWSDVQNRVIEEKIPED